MGFIFREFARKAAQKSGFSFSRGMAMMRDRRVPTSSKLAALAIGVAATALLAALEFPLEALLGIFLPIVGEGIDLVFDGVEFALAPLIISALVLPSLVQTPGPRSPAPLP